MPSKKHLAWLFLLLFAMAPCRAALPLPVDTLEIVSWISEPVTLHALHPLRVFSDRTFRANLGDARQGAACRLLAYSPEAYYIEVQGTRGSRLTGWVPPDDLSPLDPAILEKAEERKAKRLLIEEAIQKKEVVLGMTREDVTKSQGKAKRKGRSKSLEEDKETWSYIRYDRVPQIETYRGLNGYLYSRTLFVKLPVGELHIHFDKGEVVAFDETVDEPASGRSHLIR